MKVLLLTPPFIQPNSPYPATPYLLAFLQSKNIPVAQVDLSLKLHLALFSAAGLRQIYEEIIKTKHPKKSASVNFFLQAFTDYERTVDLVLQFLQGKDPTLATRIVARTLLPEGPRFLHFRQHQEQILEKFGKLSVQDLAQYMASLYLDDLYDVIRQAIDADFGFANYAESLAASQISFTPIFQKLQGPETLITRLLLRIFAEVLQEHQPDLVGFTVPFAGNFYCALKMADYLKKQESKVISVMGGGYVNTELRDLQDPRVFQSLDYLIYDDGEKPLELLIQYLQNEIPEEKLLRTKFCRDGQIVFRSDSKAHDLAFKAIQAPVYSGLTLPEYFSMIEMPNQMRRMWTGFRWNKMILAHGCYWKKCSFCDVTLDYIDRFEPQSVDRLVEQIEQVIRQTGSRGFHFVDEAAPPALLKKLSQELLKRKLTITWWGNLRFDSQFDEELVSLMADAGCVAVTGGLEVADPRLLKLINKGLSIEQVAKVTALFKAKGIFVHAYLMYGFPSQTTQETIDSLEVVRQLFANQCLDSGFWHRFVATVHSPVGKNPERYGIQLRPMPTPKEGKFSEYSVPFFDSVQCDHEMLGRGLAKALYNYMHGLGLQEKVQVWFEEKVPAPSIAKNQIKKILQTSL